MTAFHEVLFPLDIALNSTGGPQRRTDVVTLGSGAEERNTRWAHSRRRYDAGYGVKTFEALSQVVAFFEERRGRLHGFRWRDRLDHSSAASGCYRADHRDRATAHHWAWVLMVTALLGFLGSLLGGPFARAALEAYRAKLSSENTSEKIAADLAARELAVEQRERELAVQILRVEQGRWYTALPRPLFAMAFIIYVWKVVVWDKVFGLGSTDPLSGDVAQWAMIVLTAYFGGRSIEKVARIIARR